MSLLPDSVSPLMAAVMVATSFFTSLISAAFGLGGGMAMLAVIAIALPPQAVIPIHGAVQIASNAGRMLLMLPHVLRSTILPFTVGSLIGATAGGLIAVSLPPYSIELAVGLFILWTLYGPMPPLGRFALSGGGLVSSFLTMFFGATGPFVAAIVRSLKLDRMGFVATHAALQSLQHLIKIAVFGLLGFAYGPYLGLVGMTIAAGLLGTWAGKNVLMRINERVFNTVLTAVLTLLALRLVWAGAEALLTG
ncbi:MAG TPA: sulfite exporter TauE/SafE family protein [Afifellaceae bacterium]|nr:sulfite exporter TauE/SafE family protein [Afifellaceae bacterium]